MNLQNVSSLNNLKDFITHLDSRISIHQVFTNLGIKKSSGKDSFFCPFHDDKKPSFVASSNRPVGTCLSGCGAFNQYQVVSKVLNKTYMEAVKYVAELAGENFDIESMDKVKQIQKEIFPLDENQLKYITEIRKINKDTISKFGLKAFRDKNNKLYVIFPNTKNKEIVNFKLLNTKSKNFYFTGNDTSCCFFPNNDFSETEKLIITAGEWDCMLLTQILNPNKETKIVTCSTGERSSPLDLVTQLSKKKAPNLKEVEIYYDNDITGKEGAYKIADKLAVLGIKAKIFYFPEHLAKGYDVSDFIRDGHTYQDMTKLQFEEYDPRQQTVKVNESDFNVEREVLLFVLANNKCLDDLLNSNIKISDFQDWRFQEIYKKIIFHITNENGYKYCNIDVLKREFLEKNLQDAVFEIIGARVIQTIEEFYDHIRKIQLSTTMNNFNLILNKMNMLKNTNFHTSQALQAKVVEILDNFIVDVNLSDNTLGMNQIVSKISESFDNKEVLKYHTCFSEDINQKLGGGFRVGKAHFVSGEVSLGKSIFARQQAEHASMNNIPTMVYITEAEYLEVGENTLAARASINSFYLRNNILPSEEKRSINEIIDSVNYKTDDNLFYKEAFTMSFDDIISHIKLFVRKKRVKHVIIDQLTSIPTEGNIPRKEFITKCMNKLTRLALEEDICIIVVGQLKQESQNKKNRKEGFSKGADTTDVAESADLQRLAYSIVILTGTEAKKDLVRVWFPKVRSFEKGTFCDIKAEKQYNRFRDFTDKEKTELNIMN